MRFFRRPRCVVEVPAPHPLPRFAGDDVEPLVVGGAGGVKPVRGIAEIGRERVADREMRGGGGRCGLGPGDGAEFGEEYLPGGEPVRIVFAGRAAEFEPAKISALANLLLGQFRDEVGGGFDGFHGEIGMLESVYAPMGLGAGRSLALARQILRWDSGVPGERRAAAAEREKFEAWIIGEVQSGAALPGLYPANAETKARYEAFRRANDATRGAK